jgi:hypothetical protein
MREWPEAGEGVRASGTATLCGDAEKQAKLA